MPWINTDQLTPESLTAQDAFQVYNGLDCCVTVEVHDALVVITNNAPNIIYDFERALQAPAMEMMLRGFRIDMQSRTKNVAALRRKKHYLELVLSQFAYAVWDRSLNPRSPKQLIDFFYGAMKLPEQWTSKKGVKKLSTDRESLEKLEKYFYAMPFVALIIGIRDISKQIEVLETEIDNDNRMRTSYNIAGTESGRWSSSANAFGTGTNLQNLQADDKDGKKVSIRQMFIADQNKIMVGIDLEQAESREVGWQCGVLFDDWTYLDACYAGDLHTLTCKLIWDKLPWTGDLRKDKAIAEQIFYRQYSYRDMSKRGGHGSNYLGTPWTMARHLKVPVKLMEDFQARYFGAFPAIPKWHRWTAQQLQTTQQLSTPFGRNRHFFGRPNDDTTLREAIAFVPQSSTADRMNLGVYRLWEQLGKEIEILAQVHDAVYFQCDPAIVSEITPIAMKLLDVRMTHGSHELIVPGEAKIGFNWGNYDPVRNPDGLKKFKIGEGEKRERAFSFDILNRVL